MTDAAGNDAALDDGGALAALRRRLVAMGGAAAPAGPEAAALLPLWPAPAPRQPSGPARLPACDFLDAALALGRAGAEAATADAVAALAPALHWTYGYPADPRWPGLERRVAFTQVLGGKGIWPADRLLLGFTLMAPHTFYPPHTHPAIELYLVVAGTATWQMGDAAGERRPPGAVIVHPSGIAHAMSTHAEPLLALFTWRGDIATPPEYVG